MKLQTRWKLVKYRVKGAIWLHLSLLWVIGSFFYLSSIGVFWLGLAALVLFGLYVIAYFRETKKFDTKHQEAILKIIKEA